VKRLYSSDEVIKALLRMGFQYAPKRGKGSHIALYMDWEYVKFAIANLG